MVQSTPKLVIVFRAGKAFPLNCLEYRSFLHKSQLRDTYSMSVVCNSTRLICGPGISIGPILYRREEISLPLLLSTTPVLIGLQIGQNNLFRSCLLLLHLPQYSLETPFNVPTVLILALVPYLTPHGCCCLFLKISIPLVYCKLESRKIT